jgi:hypothetical protein
MTAKVLTCVPTDRAAGIMALMVSRHVQQLPVVTDGKLVGMVSVRDLLQLRLEEVLAEADAMQKYIGVGLVCLPAGPHDVTGVSDFGLAAISCMSTVRCRCD